MPTAPRDFRYGSWWVSLERPEGGDSRRDPGRGFDRARSESLVIGKPISGFTGVWRLSKPFIANRASKYHMGTGIQSRRCGFLATLPSRTICLRMIGRSQLSAFAESPDKILELSVQGQLTVAGAPHPGGVSSGFRGDPGGVLSSVAQRVSASRFSLSKS